MSVDNNNTKPQPQKLKFIRNESSLDANEESNNEENNQTLNNKFQTRQMTFNYDKFQMAKPICKCELCEMENVFLKKAEHKKKISDIDVDFNNLEKLSKKDIKKTCNDREKDFIYILKRLQPIKSQLRGFGICIPDTVAFQNGEPQFYAYNVKGSKQIKFIKGREKLTLVQIRKYFQEKRKKLKENETNVDFNNQPKEMIIFKYADDSTQIFSENEFLPLINKRKQDMFWREIQYLQIYIKSKKFPYEIIRVNFTWSDSLKNDKLFKRAFDDIDIIFADIPPSSFDFVTNEDEETFQEELRNSSINDYCLYMLYKLYIFIERFYKKRVIQSINEFVRNDQNEIYYINAYHSFIYKNFLILISYDVHVQDFCKNFTNYTDLYNELIEDPEIKHKTIMQKKYDELQKTELSDLFSKLFYQDYEQKKNKEGLELHISKPEDTLNENIFNRLYPNSFLKYNELLSNKMNIEDIKRVIISGIEVKESENKLKKFGNTTIRKKLFSNYTLPYLKKKYEKNIKTSTSTGFYKRDLPNDKNMEYLKTSPLIKSTTKGQIKSVDFFKNSRIKLTYQLGSSITNIHSIRMDGKVYDEIEKNLHRQTSRQFFVHKKLHEWETERNKKNPNS